MPRPIHELVEELRRLKPGSPVLRHFTDIADGMDWWNSLYPTERAHWLKVANSSAPVDAWRAFKLARIGDAIVAVGAREFGRALLKAELEE